MNVGEIKAAAAAYLQVSVEDFVINGVDLGLIALNSAKKSAERFHDWNCEYVLGDTTVSGGQGSWLNVDVNSTSVKLKQPETFYLKVDGNYIPLYHHSKKHGAVQAKERLRGLQMDQEYRWSGDVTYVSSRFQTNGRVYDRYEVYVQNTNFTVEPTPSEDITISIDGYQWLDDYTSDSDEDFFTEHGQDYLMWAVIVDINYRVQAFVPQQEGNLSPPDRMRDDALASLKEYDAFIVENGRQPE